MAMSMSIAEYINAYQQHPYELGKHDCWSFVSGYLRATDRGEFCDWVDENIGENYADNPAKFQQVLTPRFLARKLELQTQLTDQDFAIIQYRGVWGAGLIYDGDIYVYIAATGRVGVKHWRLGLTLYCKVI